jgi:hypothetical protein
VIAALLSDIEYMEHRHLSLLLKHAIEPLVLNCPSHQLNTLLPPLLAPLISHMLKRLSTSWQYDPDEYNLKVIQAKEQHLPAAWRRDGGLVSSAGNCLFEYHLNFFIYFVKIFVQSCIMIPLLLLLCCLNKHLFFFLFFQHKFTTTTN